MNRAFFAILLSSLIAISALGFAALPPLDDANGVSSYLQGLRAQYDANIEQKMGPIHIVIGNEAADLDSISAAIARAKYLSLDPAIPEKSVYPVVNISREDLSLRRDAEYLFSLLNVDAASILFIDDVPLDYLAAKGRLQLHLVDHNVLAKHQVHLSNDVVSIVDHHVDECVHYPLCSEKDKVVAKVGSATTFVSRDILQEEDVKLDSSWATLLLAPILLDTMNLQSPTITTMLDREIVQELQVCLDDLSLIDFFERLLALRSDTLGLTPDELLRKDVKRYQDGELVYTISSLPQCIDYQWDKDPTFFAALQEFRKKQGVSIAMVLEMGLDQYRRLHIHCESSDRLEQLLQSFRNGRELSKIATLERIDRNRATATWILPISVTRKVLQPYLFQYT